jgi:hypothetical protein
MTFLSLVNIANFLLLSLKGQVIFKMIIDVVIITPAGSTGKVMLSGPGKNEKTQRRQ